LIDPSTRGDPMTVLRWTSKSTYKLAADLCSEGHKVSPRTVARLLLNAGYSLQANSKTREGMEHPDRNAQFEFINTQSKLFMRQKQPVISVDAKKKENIGNFANKGREWNPKGQPEKVKTHDFVDPELGKAIPYGTFDLTNNEGWVSIGIDHDTADFAVTTIQRWWKEMGKSHYGETIKKLYINADGGGSNSSRSRLWKISIQKFANELEVPIHVSHFPPGTSKWNKIEHRLFSQITKNWRGRPLTSLGVIVNLIANTTTNNGLKVKAEIDTNTYLTGVKVSDEEFEKINLKPAKFHGDWNYCIAPN
jgi:hypothetical protein